MSTSCNRSSVSAFDFPARALPPNVRYVGPQLDDPAWAQPWTSPWPDDHPDPLMVVGLSSTFQDQGALLQKVIDALGGMRVRGLMTLGPALDAAWYRERMVAAFATPVSLRRPLLARHRPPS